MWVSLEAALSPVEPWDDCNSGRHLDYLLWEILSQRTQWNCTWIPDWQTLWDNKCCSKSLSLGVIFCTIIDNEHIGELKVLSNQASLPKWLKLHYSFQRIKKQTITILSMTGNLIFFFLGTPRCSTSLGFGSDHCNAGFNPWIFWRLLMTARVNNRGLWVMVIENRYHRR